MPVSILLIWLNPGNSGIFLAAIMALVITPAITAPLMELVMTGSRMGELTVALRNIDDIMKLEPVSIPAKPQLPRQFDVTFHDVSFTYQNTADPLHTMALSKISLTVPQGKMTALVGPSGGGKSTVGQLISRFWDVSSGKITIGDVDIRDIHPDRLMDTVSFVFQDTTIFADTVRGNITMNRDISDEQVEAAAKAAQCHDFIMRLPPKGITLASAAVGRASPAARCSACWPSPGPCSRIPRSSCWMRRWLFLTPKTKTRSKKPSTG